MGDNGTTRATEDELRSLHPRNLIDGRPGDPEAICRVILASMEAAGFRDPAISALGDLDIALDIDRYDLAIGVGSRNGRPVAQMKRII